MRRDLAENIVIIGGTSMLPGFHHRLCVELYHLLKNNKYQNELSIKLFKFHKLLTKENCACWLGGIHQLQYIYMQLYSVSFCLFKLFIVV